MTTFDVELTTRATLHPDGEPHEFVSTYTGVVLATGDDGDATEVGRLSALELHVLHTLLYAFDDYVFKGSLQRRFSATDTDLLVLDYVALDPKWRGLRLGLLAVRRIVDLLGDGCGLAVAEVSPLRPEAFRYL